VFPGAISTSSTHFQQYAIPSIPILSSNVDGHLPLEENTSSPSSAKAMSSLRGVETVIEHLSETVREYPTNIILYTAIKKNFSLFLSQIACFASVATPHEVNPTDPRYLKVLIYKLIT
jgi:hypothetical protein